ncbi:MAG: hypothetical protein GYB21_08955 [Oceanospirillales bacterium]|nr:hypothetical protein [Oceanospirillales bacterium]
MKKEIKNASIVLVQKHQLDQGQKQLGDVNAKLASLEQQASESDDLLDDMLEMMEASLQEQGIAYDEFENSDYSIEIEAALTITQDELAAIDPGLSLLDTLDKASLLDWNAYLDEVQLYAARNEIDLDEDPFSQLMTESQRIEIEKRINDEFTFKQASCDKYDYMIAGTCGLIGGLIDVLFVGLPGEGKLTQLADNAVDSAVERFASFNGWEGPREGSDPTSSAIGFLERKFKVNYDHRHGGDVDGLFKMSTKNHHIKSLGHSPDLVGLFFSVLGQFTNTAHFVDSGKLIVIDTETSELQGSNFVSKIFSGFVNWLGHLFSDVAGSSGATGRGSGIPIPFFSLLQFVEVGEFGQHRQTFAKISVQVFEQGYDFRHGLAMAIPVLVTELLTRAMWTAKQRWYHKREWGECVPSASNPELRRMLLVAHGGLCLVDAGDAAIRSGGEIIQFMLRSNMIAWVRFGTLALKEITVWYSAGQIDIEAADLYLEREYERMLSSSTYKTSSL